MGVAGGLASLDVRMAAGAGCPTRGRAYTEAGTPSYQHRRRPEKLQLQLGNKFACALGLAYVHCWIYSGCGLLGSFLAEGGPT